MPVKRAHLNDFAKLLASVRTSAESARLLEDLLTPQEHEELARRWQIVQMLWRRMPQRDIAKKLKVSVSKITRGSRAMQYGSGGFELFLKRLKKPRTPPRGIRS
jgi:TrpR family trp operon transcriptional repressor